MNCFTSIIEKTFRALAEKTNKQDFINEVNANFQFKLAIVSYIEFYGPHTEYLVNAITKLLSIHLINPLNLVTFVIHHTDIKSFDEYHKNKVFKEKKCHKIIIEWSKFINSLIKENNFPLTDTDSIEIYLQAMSSYHTSLPQDSCVIDLDINELIFHPFIAVMSQHCGLSVKFTHPSHNQVYWGIAMLYGENPRTTNDKTLVLLSTYLEILVQTMLVHKQKALDDKSKCLSSSLDSSRENNALNCIADHFKASVLKDTNLCLERIRATNYHRYQSNETYFDDRSIDLIINTLECLTKDTTTHKYSNLYSEMHSSEKSTFSNKINF